MTIDTSNLDAGTDSPRAARAQLLQAVQFCNDLSSTMVGTGSKLVAFTQRLAGAVSRWVEDKLAEEVSTFDFMSDTQRADILAGTGLTSVSAAVQAAIDALPARGGRVKMPSGVYLFTTPVKMRDRVKIKGDGDATKILVNTDIEVFTSDSTTLSTSVFMAQFEDFWIQKTVTGATTKYDIHLYNPIFCRFKRVHVQSGHDDTSYSSTNVGGIFLEKPTGSTSSAYCNTLADCWIQNNSVYFANITDSTIRGGYIWGHTRQFAVRIQGTNVGNIDIGGVSGIISSKYNGGIWLDGAGINQIRVTNNNHDGNPALDTGAFIYSPQSTIAVVVTSNNIWGCDKQGIDTVDPVGWNATGNSFWRCNAADASYDDIRITGATFSPRGNNFSVNTHLIDDARTNKGYAVHEVNAGFTPLRNAYNNNAVNGNYLDPSFLVIQAASLMGNVGPGLDERTIISGRAAEFGGSELGGPGALVANNSADVAAAGTLDLTINTATFGGQPGGFVGTLTVAATRNNSVTQSTITMYDVVFRGTTATITSRITSNGSGGGSAFTITMGSAGVIRFTDTSGSGSTIGVRMACFGSKVLA